MKTFRADAEKDPAAVRSPETFGEIGAVQRPPIQHHAIENTNVTSLEEVIEGCGDRVDPRVYSFTLSSDFNALCAVKPALGFARRPDVIVTSGP